ncbi:hypothetical protein pb186bvf_000904 [Paramecium bursaria]
MEKFSFILYTDDFLQIYNKSYQRTLSYTHIQLIFFCQQWTIFTSNFSSFDFKMVPIHIIIHQDKGLAIQQVMEYHFHLPDLMPKFQGDYSFISPIFYPPIVQVWQQSLTLSIWSCKQLNLVIFISVLSKQQKISESTSCYKFTLNKYQHILYQLCNHHILIYECFLMNGNGSQSCFLKIADLIVGNFNQEKQQIKNANQLL